MALGTERPGYVQGGTLVEFRMEITKELLWEASMRFLPSIDDVLYLNSHAYEVKAIEFHFSPVMTNPEPPDSPNPVPGGLAPCDTIVVVREGM